MVSVTKDSTVRFTALRGIAARKLRHIRPHGNFMLSGVFDGWGNVSCPHLFVFIHHHHQSWIMLSIKRNGKTAETVVSSIMIQWCLSSIILNHESMMCVFIHYESIINEWWILNRQSSIISPLIAMVKMFAVSLVARWRTAAFSQFCLQIALPYKKGNRKLIVPWPSFNTHRTTDNAHACQSYDSRTVCTSWKYHDPLTVYITASDAAVLSLTTICTSSRIYVLLCLLA